MNDSNLHASDYPRLKTYYAIFVSGFIGLYIILLILGELNSDPLFTIYLGVFIPLVVTCFIGFAAATNDHMNYLCVQRSVPGAYNGLNMAFTSLGSVGFLGYIGAVFFLGYDALSIGLGWALGFAILTVFFASAFRKMGAFTLPGFFARYYESDLLRLVAALITLLISSLFLIAEMKLGVFIGSLVLNVSEPILWAGLSCFIVFCVITGGLRSLTWAQCAQYLIVILGFLIPLVIISLQLTNMPLPQLTYGSALDDLAQIERASGITLTSPQNLDVALPGQNPVQLSKPFAQSFGKLSTLDFILLTLCIMCGVATLPAVISRLSTTAHVSVARRSAAWGLAFVALFVVSAPAYALFTKLTLFEYLAQFQIDQAPQWVADLEQKGVFAFSGDSIKPSFDMSNLSIARDSVFLILPWATTLPFIFAVLAVCTALLYAISATSAHIVTMANSLSHDLLYSIAKTHTSRKKQVTVSRISLLICLFGAAILYFGFLNKTFDGFKMMLWGISLSASAFFAPLALTVWWRRCTAPGALAGMLAGFGAAGFYIWLSQSEALFFALSGLTSAAIGVPLSFLATFGVSLYSHKSMTKEQTKMFEKLHIPGGEPIYEEILQSKGRHSRSQPQIQASSL